MSGNLSKEDWFEVIRQNVKITAIREYLGSSHDALYCTRKVYRHLSDRNTICVVLEDFMQTHRYKVEKKSGVFDDNFYAIQKEDIELGCNKFKKVITEGQFFITCGLTKLVVDLGDDYGNWIIRVFYNDGAEENALNFLSELEAYSKEHNYLKNTKIDASLKHIDLDRVYTWDDIILPESVLHELQINTSHLFEDLELYRKNNLTFKRGIILKGVPGTGKTLIGKILCSQAKCSFIWVTPKFMLHPKHISEIGNLARELAPSILFLEDMDLYGESRESNSNAGLLGELMNQLDGLIENKYVVTIATTNKPENIEDALRNRPGRFDRVLDISKPDTLCRKKMLQLHIGSCICEGIDLDKIASRTEGFTGAHIKELVTTAIVDAIESNSLTEDKKIILKELHFVNNLSKVKSKEFTKTMGFSEDSTEYPLVRYSD